MTKPRPKPKLRYPDTVGLSQDRLAQFFYRNGYIRVPNEERFEEGQKYKKGWEVRLPLRSRAELDEVRRLLREVGLKAGTPFNKGKQLVQPIYGRRPVDIFLSWTRKV